MKPTDTLVVVPCFNEAERLDPAAFELFCREDLPVRLLLVDDGSTDATADIIEKLAATHPDRLGFLRLDRNRGKAEAVRRGVLESIQPSLRYFGYWDADLATPLSAIERFRTLLIDSPNLIGVLGSRWRHLGNRIDRGAIRHYSGRVFATLASMTLRMPVYDTQCGSKLFRNCEETLAAFATPFGNAWTFDVELIARLALECRESRGTTLEGALIEAPLETWIDKGASKVRLHQQFGMLLGLARIRIRYGRQLRSG